MPVRLRGLGAFAANGAVLSATLSAPLAAGAPAAVDVVVSNPGSATVEITVSGAIVAYGVVDGHFAAQTAAVPAGSTTTIHLTSDGAIAAGYEGYALELYFATGTTLASLPVGTPQSQVSGYSIFATVGAPGTTISPWLIAGGVAGAALLAVGAYAAAARSRR